MGFRHQEIDLKLHKKQRPMGHQKVYTSTYFNKKNIKSVTNRLKPFVFSPSETQSTDFRGQLLFKMRKGFTSPISNGNMDSETRQV